MPNVRPASTENDTSRTAWTTPSGVGNETDRSSTSSRLIGALLAEPQVGDVAQCVRETLEAVHGIRMQLRRVLPHHRHDAEVLDHLLLRVSECRYRFLLSLGRGCRVDQLVDLVAVVEAVVGSPARVVLADVLAVEQRLQIRTPVDAVPVGDPTGCCEVPDAASGGIGILQVARVEVVGRYGLRLQRDARVLQALLQYLGHLDVVSFVAVDHLQGQAVAVSGLVEQLFGLLEVGIAVAGLVEALEVVDVRFARTRHDLTRRLGDLRSAVDLEDRKSTRLNSSHVAISYAVF